MESQARQIQLRSEQVSTRHGTDSQSDYSNGNIREIKRNAYGTTNPMDDLFFHIKAHNNQLTQVDDGLGLRFNTDLASGQLANNYEYDYNGSLTKDLSEGIGDNGIEWTASGKVKSVTRNSDSQKDDLEFFYDGLGNRYLKVAKTKSGPGVFNSIDLWEFTYYVRDAQGNVLETYQHRYEEAIENLAYWERLELMERNWYGSNRLGSDVGVKQEVAYAYFTVDAANYPFDGDRSDKENLQPVVINPNSKNFVLKRGFKQYELTNHLGNVLATVSDKRYAIDGNYKWVEGASETGTHHFSFGSFTNSGTGSKNYMETIAPDALTYDFYRPNITMSNRYYPFGMVQPHPDNVSGNYRFGFNGMEKDDEVYNSSGTSYDFGARMLDTRIGRWSAKDPLAAKYPGYSPYNFVGNSPIKFIDPDGKEIVIHGKDGTPTIYKPMMEPQGDEFTMSAIKALNDIHGTLEGRKVVNKLWFSEQTYDIQSAESRSGNKFIPDNSGIGGGSINVHKEPWFVKYRTEFTFINNLSHELYHAYQLDIGVSNYLLLSKVFFKRYPPIEYAEVQAVGFENYIRAELTPNLGARDNYDGYDDNDILHRGPLKGMYNVNGKLFGDIWPSFPDLDWFKSDEGIQAWKYDVRERAKKEMPKDGSIFKGKPKGSGLFKAPKKARPNNEGTATPRSVRTL